jgi:hypothetical protein
MSSGRLPVLGTAVLGWRLLAGDWSVLLRIAVPPLAVLGAIDVYLDASWERWLENSDRTSSEYVTSGLYMLTTWDMVLALILGGLIAALWHRVRLTGRRTLSIFGLLAAWRNIVALTVHWCALILVTIGLTRMISVLVGPWATRFLDEALIGRLGLISHLAIYDILMDLLLDGGPLLIALYISGRLGLMLWARPAGGEGVLDRAWAAGDGNGWRIAAAIFVAILPVKMLASVLQPGPIQGGGLLGFHLWFDLSNLLQLIVAVAVIAAADRTLLGADDAPELPALDDVTER